MTAAQLTIVSFQSRPDVRAYDCRTLLSNGVYRETPGRPDAQNDGLDDKSRGLVYHLHGVLGLSHIWLVPAPGSAAPNRLLAFLQPKWEWRYVEHGHHGENGILDWLVRHFGWSYVDLDRHITRRTSATDPLQGLPTEPA